MLLNCHDPLLFREEVRNFAPVNPHFQEMKGEQMIDAPK